MTAPRATSTYSSQAKVNRTGAVFQCDLQTGECAQYRLLAPGSDGTEQRVEQGYIYIKPDREYGWLGAAMDGPNRIDDPLVVCAPRWKNMYYSNRIESIYLVNGMCYFLNDASQVENEAVALIPLKDTSE